MECGVWNGECVCVCVWSVECRCARFGCYSIPFLDGFKTEKPKKPNAHHLK